MNALIDTFVSVSDYALILAPFAWFAGFLLGLVLIFVLGVYFWIVLAALIVIAVLVLGDHEPHVGR